MSFTRVRPAKPSRSGTRRVLTGSVVPAALLTPAAATVGTRLTSQALRPLVFAVRHPSSPAAPMACRRATGRAALDNDTRTTPHTCMFVSSCRCGV
jgi:hypothetical protein